MKEFNRDEYISECYSEPAHSVRRPHKHAELIKQWADGAEIEWVGATKYDGTKLWSVVANPPWNESHEYRIKPEPKPDVVVKEHIQLHHFENSPYPTVVGDRAKFPNVKFTFDGETGELKSAEVLK